jgi:hypothetical protein
MKLDLTPHDTAVRSDPVAQLALTLAKELWQLKDRQLVLEAVLSREGLAVAELVDRFQPDGEFKRALAAERERFVAAIIEALQRPGDRA